MAERFPRGRPLPTLVNLEIMLSAGFNYWETSLISEKKGQKYNVYVGFNPDRQLHLVIAERTDVPKRVWYFGTFSGSELLQLEGSDAYAEYFRKVEEVIDKKNKISGKKLEAAIIQVFTS